jgi:hypothetical protein
MLHGIKIENTLFGGPAFGLLKKGDILAKIDGQFVTEENILTALRGGDIPGTKVFMTVLRAKQDQSTVRPRGSRDVSVSSSPDVSAEDEEREEIELCITRIATAEIADRRRMFDLFTFLEVSLVIHCVDSYLLLIFAGFLNQGPSCCQRRPRGCIKGQ